MAHINEFGQEVLDQTPKCLPVPFRTRELTIFDRVRMQLAEYQRQHAPDETPEDALDMGDDEDEYSDFESRLSRAELNDIMTQRVKPKPESELKPEPEPKPESLVDGE